MECLPPKTAEIYVYVLSLYSSLNRVHIGHREWRIFMTHAISNQRSYSDTDVDLPYIVDTIPYHAKHLSRNNDHEYF